MSDNHHSSLLRGEAYELVRGDPGGLVEVDVENLAPWNPYWNIEVCESCGGSGNEPSGVEYAGISEMVGCEECYGIGYTNERIREVLEQLEGMI